MKEKGSITIFFTLLLSVMISLIGTLLLSAKVAAGRTQIAAAADLAMFSAMAKYDRALFEEYHLLYIDGGFGTGTLQLGKALDEIESDLSYLLTPNKKREHMGGKNLLQLERISGSIIGYTLATDCDGSVFYEQAVSYMEDTLGLQGLSLLSQKLSKESDLIKSRETALNSMENRGCPEDYQDIKREIEMTSKNNDIKNSQNNESEDTEEAVTEKDREQALRAESVIEGAAAVKKGTILQMVLSKNQPVSDWAGDLSKLYGSRERSSGMGYLELTRDPDNITDGLLFQEYILQNLNHYGERIRDTGPAYGVEWVLFEKTSDIENLETMINRLMLIREAANAVSLRADSHRYGQIQSMARSLAAVLKAPAIQYILEGILVLAWAFAESVVDVRGLLEGKAVPLVKGTDSWQVEFMEILPAIQSPTSYYEAHSGMKYEDYLRTMLFMKSKEKKITGCMEVIEASIQEIPGKENFSMDCAVDSLETEFSIRSQRLITFTIAEKRSYRTI